MLRQPENGTLLRLPRLMYLNVHSAPVLAEHHFRHAITKIWRERSGRISLRQDGADQLACAVILPHKALCTRHFTGKD